MAIQITFYKSFSKKLNSTKIPATETGVTVEGLIKGTINILSPSIQIAQTEFSTTGALPPSPYYYTYAHVFGRYFYVRNWFYVDGFWIADLEIDVLATYNTQIKESTQYVKRYNGTASDSVVDTIYPAKAAPVHLIGKPSAQPFAYNFSDGMYVVGVVNGGQSGAVTYYAVGPTFYKALMQNVFSATPYYQGIEADEISEEFFRSIINPAQYIESVRWYPMQAVPEGTEKATYFKIGMVQWAVTSGSEFTNSIYVIDNPYMQQETDITSLANHPSKERLGLSANLAPWTVRKLYYPPFGEFVLESESFSLPGTIKLLTDVDLTTGLARLSIRHADAIGAETIIQEAQAQFAVSIPVKSSTYDLSGKGFSIGKYINPATIIGAARVGEWAGQALNSAISAIGGEISSDLVNITPIQDAFTSIGQITASLATKHELQGEVGSILAFRHEVRLDTWQYIPIDENLNGVGRPLCQNVTLSSLEGKWIMCPTPILELQSGQYMPELLRIIEMMRNGIWLES